MRRICFTALVRDKVTAFQLLYSIISMAARSSANSCIAPVQARRAGGQWDAKFYDHVLLTTDIPCELCQKKFASWDALLKHVRDTHGKSQGDLDKSIIGAIAQHIKHPLTDAELAFVRAADDEGRFICAVCNKERSKTTADKHFDQHRDALDEHNVTPEELSQWIVTKEGKSLRQHRQPRVTLSAGIKAYDAISHRVKYDEDLSLGIYCESDEDAPRTDAQPTDADKPEPDKHKDIPAAPMTPTSKPQQLHDVGSPGANLLNSLNTLAHEALATKRLDMFEYYFTKAEALQTARTKTPTKQYPASSQQSEPSSSNLGATVKAPPPRHTIHYYKT